MTRRVAGPCAVAADMQRRWAPDQGVLRQGNRMQLRIARLCLDCEELHVADACPICASERYAFLSAWLPSEERRRWRRPAPAFAPEPHGVRRIVRVIARWFNNEPGDAPRPRTRAADHVPRFGFEPPIQNPKKPADLEPRRAHATRDGRR